MINLRILAKDQRSSQKFIFEIHNFFIIANKNNDIPSKVPYFFFPWKSLRPLTHSISDIIVSFFSENWEKKNTAVLFFFPERVYMPLTQLFRRSFGGKGILFQKYYF